MAKTVAGAEIRVLAALGLQDMLVSECIMRGRIMASDSVAKEYSCLDVFKCLKSMINDLDNIKFSATYSRLLTQEYDNMPWEIKYLVNKSIVCLAIGQDYLSDACDICRTDLAQQSDGADK